MSNTIYCPHCMAQINDSEAKCPYCKSKVDVANKSYQLSIYSILNARYLVGEAIGEGGFGITYVGFDLKLNLKVAIKEYFISGCVTRTHEDSVTPTTVSPDKFNKGKEKFLLEAKTLSQFSDDENIVRVRDYFEENNTAYIIMEYVEGETLHAFLTRNGPISFDSCMNLLKPVMSSLSKVHNIGFIHRDISPSNIMITIDGKAKLLDFGAARLQNITGEKSLSVLLKPGYAPIEQYISHGEQGPWTDEYALCATIYKLITGITPETSTERDFDDKLTPPSELGAKISEAQQSVLLKGMSVKKEDRYSDIGKLITAFENPTSVKDTKKKANRIDEKSKKRKLKKYATIAAISFVMSAAIGILLTFVFDGVTAKEIKKIGQKIESEINTKEEEGDGYTISETYLPVEVTWIDENTGDVSSKTHYSYDDNGWLKELVYTYYFSHDGETTQTETVFEYTYDEKGNTLQYKNDRESCIFNQEYGKDDNLHRTLYDNEGNMSSYYTIDAIDDYHDVETCYYPDGTQMSSINSTYNEEGQLLLSEEIDNEGNISTYTYEYDSDNNMINQLYVYESSSGSYEYRTEHSYEYDGYGRITSAKRYYSGYESGEYTGTYVYESIKVKHFNKD